MRNAFSKDIFREIKNTIGRFLGILAIVALGVSFYSGLGATGKDMEISGDIYLDAQNLMDIRVISNYGINNKDIAALKAIDGVKEVYPSYNTDVMASIGDGSLIMKLYSIDVENNEINRPVILSGRMPERSNEILVEASFLSSTGYDLGYTVSLSSGKKTDLRNTLRHDQYVICGTIKSPYYISKERGSGSIGSGSVDFYVFIPQEAFLQSVYSEVFISVEGAKEKFAFDDEYADLIEEVADRIEARTDLRVVEKTEEISKSRFEQLNAAETALKKQIAETNNEFDTAFLQLDSGQTILDKSLSGLAEKGMEIEEGLGELSESRAKIDSGLAELQAAEGSLHIVVEDLLISRQSLLDIEQYMTEGEYSAQLALVDAGIATATASLAELTAQESELIHSLYSLEELESDAQLGSNELSDSRRTIAASGNTLEEQRNSLLQQQKEANEGFALAKKQLALTRIALNDLSEVKYYVLDRDTNIGFSGYKEDASKISAIGTVFPLIFFLVAALVSLTTMTRLVEERRVEVGTLKSLGYGNFTIMSKYLIYALIPTLLGGIFGAMIGMDLFPKLIINAYNMLYSMPPPTTPFNYFYFAASMSFALVCTVGAAFFACNTELRETPSNLMRPRAPKAGKRIWLEYISPVWKRLNFTYKLTVRNIFRYKKRFLMTVIGISGCTALLLTGFGVKNSISDLMTKQYDKIFVYDMITNFEDDAKQKDIDHVKEILYTNQMTPENTGMMQKSMEAGIKGGGIENVTIIVPENPEEIDKFINLHERVNRDPVPISNDGVVITERLADLLNVEIGSMIYIKDGDNNLLDARVSGISENYFMHNLFMTASYYEQIFNEKPEYNAIYSNFSKDDKEKENELAAELLDSKGVSALSFSRTVRKSFGDTIQQLNFVVIVLIVSAGLLAFVVLLNLTNINISERIRELATIEVLGFYDKEVSAYVFRENVVLTFIGAMAGLVLGIALHRYVILTAETSAVMFSRDIQPLSYIYSVILTFAFAFCVNIISAGKLKKINMVEALKSVE